MKTPQRKGQEARLDAFRIARKLLEHTLHPIKSAFDKVAGYLRQRNIPMLAELGQIQDREYHDPDEWSTTLALRQVASLFKKNDAFADSEQCAAVAKENFLRSERRCRITNKRLTYYYLNPSRNDPVLVSWLSKMEQEIASLLGDTQAFEDLMPSLIRLTNGATEDRPRKRSMPFLKITGKLRAPRAAVPFLGKLLLGYGVDLSLCTFTSVERNVITLVPKNWKTFRTIAKEPTHALPFQLALDSFFKRKLRRWGVDLSSQSRNQEFARLGSIDGSIATIDLEMASDTLSIDAVSWLFPSDWYELLVAFRSSYYSAPWGTGKYAKFSSMGNGYTFTLETLIFTAACRAVGCRRYAVYGDDIAVETPFVKDLTRLLRFLGFRTNDAKSFVNPASRFRESCGCDYYKGHLVTPFYLRECPRLSDRAGVSHVLNGLIAATSVPGPLWDWAAVMVRELGLRLVPWNEDSRSGVFITPGEAWRRKELWINERRYIGAGNRAPADVLNQARINPLFGFPVYKGYAPVQSTRSVKGWRSLLLWHLEKSYNGDRPKLAVANRTSSYLMGLNGRLSQETTGAAIVTSCVSEGSRYVHKTRRYDPKPMATPCHLFLWDEIVRQAHDVRLVAPRY